MKNFGRLKPSRELVEIPGVKIAETETGEPIFEAGKTLAVIFFRDGDGVDIVDAAKLNPHPFYIAVDGRGSIVSMADDIEHSQIDGLDIIGIDQDYGFSWWQGGNVYGKIWNGLAINEPETNEFLLPDEISRRQFFQHLTQLEIITRQEALSALQNGAIPSRLQEIIDQLPSEDSRFEAQMFVIGAQNFHRLHWLTDAV